MTTIGFDNEDDMVKGLAATNRSQSQTCFIHGAGKTMYYVIFMCLSIHIYEQVLYLIILMEPELSTLFV